MIPLKEYINGNASQFTIKIAAARSAAIDQASA
jgi:hypothetical protein